MNKTVLITGASKGIGKEIARLFSNNNYNVIINYNNSEDDAINFVNELKKTNYNVIAIKADVSKREQVNEMFKKAKKEFGTVDVLINNAGISHQQLFTDIKEEQWDRIFDVNVKGMFNCTQNAIPLMLQKHKGKIINISSMWGVTGASCETSYSATKAAIIGLTKALAKELGLSNIQVNCIAPGVIDTQMNSHLDNDTIEELKDCTPLGRIGTGEDIAQTALFLADDKSNFITGQIIGVNGGFLI